MGFNAYFLIVWDFVTYAKDAGIAVGPGRGSAAGSIVAFCLRITDLDPLRYDLMFERFLNPERVSMPDIDMDFSVRGRERVIRYVTEKYGKGAVAQIVTFGKMFPRAATRDAARVLGHDYGTGDRLAKLIPDPEQGRAPKFKDCLAVGTPLRAEVDRDGVAKQIVDVAQGLEGIVRNSSIHAAAVVISDRNLTEILPLQIAEAGTDETRRQGLPDRHPVLDEAGRGARAAEDGLPRPAQPRRDRGRVGHRAALQRRATRHGNARARRSPRPTRCSPPATRSASSSSSRRACGRRSRRSVPTEFNDLVALGALYRPGAMDSIPTYARGKQMPESISYADERLRPILESTKGVIIYQEQAMQIAKDLAGFSGAKADDLRKAIGKKNREAMAALKPEFYAGCRASGTSDSVIDLLWTTNERSADYSFNKSHAACYALISYRTAWLKANYPAEYMAALISSVMDTKDRVPFFVAQAEQMGIEILPPDVNQSDHEFVVVDGNIRFGLDAVKGVGFQAVEAIKAARGDVTDAVAVGGAPSQPFTSLFEFCERVDNRAVNKKAIEALIKCGAFGSTGDSRKGMLSVLEQAQAAGAKSQQDKLIGQGSIFDLAMLGDGDGDGDGDGGVSDGAAPAFSSSHAPIPGEEFDQSAMLAAEKESLGLFISAHPLREVGPALRKKVDCAVGEIVNRKDQEWVTIGGIIQQFKKIKTKKGDMMAFATVSDLEESVELVVFGSVLESAEQALAVDTIVLVRGKVDHKDANKIGRAGPAGGAVRAAAGGDRQGPGGGRQAGAAAGSAAPVRRCDRAAADRAGRSEAPAGRFARRGRGRDRAGHLQRAPAAEARPRLPRRPHRRAARSARPAARPGAARLAADRRRGIASRPSSGQPGAVPAAEPLGQPVGLRRAPGSLRVDDRLRRMLQQRRHDAPALLDAVLAGEVAGVARHRGRQQHLVGGGRLAALLRELHIEVDLRGARLVGPLGVERHAHAGAGIDPDHDLVGCRAAPRRLFDERQVRWVAQHQPDLCRAERESLAGANEERDAGPAPVVDREPQRDVGLGVGTLGDAVNRPVAVVLAADAVFGRRHRRPPRRRRSWRPSGGRDRRPTAPPSRSRRRPASGG